MSSKFTCGDIQESFDLSSVFSPTDLDEYNWTQQHEKTVMHFIQKPAKAECLYVDDGIKAFRAHIDDTQALTLEMATTELMWLITRKGQSEIRHPMETEVVSVTTRSFAKKISHILMVIYLLLDPQLILLEVT